MKRRIVLAVSLLVSCSLLESQSTAELATPSASALLHFDFNAPSDWPGATSAGAGTIDVRGTNAGSGAIVYVVDANQAAGQWTASLTSGPVAVKNAETNLAKLTMSFSLSASSARPVKVVVESFDSSRARTGGLETKIYPAAPDFYQRYSIDLSTMKPSGDGAFRPTDSFVQIRFELEAGTGWANDTRHELRLDNLNYAVPAYYVSPNGSDTNDGRSEDKAFATPQAALDRAGPGDIVLLRAGTYNGGLAPTARFVRPGTPEAWIVLKNYPGETPLLTGNAWNTVSLAFGSNEENDTENSLAYIEIRGLHLRGEGDVVEKKYPDSINKPDSRSNTNGIAVDGRYMKNKPHHIRVADNLVEYMPACGIGAGDGDWITVENNITRYNCWTTIYGCSGISVMGAYNFDSADNVYKNLVRNNISYRNETYQQWVDVKRISDGNGIILDVNEEKGQTYIGRTLVTNNLSYDNGGSGIHCVTANRVDIVNNTTYLNSASKALQYPQIFTYESRDVRIMNNILVAPVADVAAGEKPEPVNKNGGKNKDVVFSNNLYIGGNIPPTLGDADQVGDPQFVNPSRDPKVADFHLKPTSPSRGAGRRSEITPSIDLDGKLRPVTGPVDLGAYQH